MLHYRLFDDSPELDDVAFWISFSVRLKLGFSASIPQDVGCDEPAVSLVSVDDPVTKLPSQTPDWASLLGRVGYHLSLPHPTFILRKTCLPLANL